MIDMRVSRGSVWVTMLAGLLVSAACVKQAPASQPGKPEFEFRHVVITLDYDGRPSEECGREAKGSIVVDPYQAGIFFPGRDTQPRQVRWVVRGLERGDVLAIRPEEGESKELFLPEAGGEFRVPGGFSSVASGVPNDPEFGADPKWRVEDRTRAAAPYSINGEGRALIWNYAIEVTRDGERVLYCDPEIMIEEDG